MPYILAKLSETPTSLSYGHPASYTASRMTRLHKPLANISRRAINVTQDPLKSIFANILFSFMDYFKSI